MNDTPIGILDSGLGGLTVWRQIVDLLPYESTVYIADSKNIPYGQKTPETIFVLAKRLVEFLISKKVKIIVIACNTITVSSIDRLRREFPQVPFIGTVPVVKRAAIISKNKKIGILSTTRTSDSAYQKKLIERFASDCEVVSVGSDQLVNLIEEGITGGKRMKNLLKEVLAPFITAKVDTICLGCTHFPFVDKEISSIVGKKVLLLEPSSAIARHTKNILLQNNQLAIAPLNPKRHFYTSGDVVMFEKVAKTLLKAKIQAQGIDL